MIGIEIAEGERGESFDVRVLGHNDFLKKFCALNAQLVVGLDARGGRIGFEIAPSGLLGNIDKVEVAAAGNLDFDGNGIADGDIGWASAEGHGVTADGAVEAGGDIFGGKRADVDGLLFDGKRDLLLFHRWAKEAVDIERIHLAAAASLAINDDTAVEGIKCELAVFDGSESGENGNDGKLIVANAACVTFALHKLAGGETVSAQRGDLGVADFEDVAAEVKAEFDGKNFAEVEFFFGE